MEVEIEKRCVKCGRDYTKEPENYCGTCGNKVVEMRKDFIKANCKICNKPIIVHKDATMNLCDYHWDIYDANDGY